MSPEEIKAFRKAIGVSQARLAEILGITTRAVELWESGKNQPPAYLGLALAAVNANLKPWGG